MERSASSIIKTLPWLVVFAKRILFHALKRLTCGQLMLNDGGEHKVFGKADSNIQASINVKHNDFYRQILFGGSIGAAEAYIQGHWDTDDITSVVRLFAANLKLLDEIECWFGWFINPINRIGHLMKRNSHQGSKRNILAHYDLGNELYQQFLDKEMLYSSALYPSEQASLDEAQIYKMQLICERLELKAGQSLLEIGTGWGALAIYAAKHYDVQVTTTTISDAQYLYAKARIKAEGLTNKINLLKQDYRLLEGQFDRLVSVEMIEAVGHEYLPEFFQKLGTLLKEDGRMLLQAITIADQRYNSYRKSVDFIQKYIFPGGCLPSISRITELLKTRTNMVLWSLDDIGLDYAKTLKHWHRNFDSSLTEILQLGYGEDFIRMWKFYLSYCEGGFLERTTSVVHLVAVKPDYRCDKQVEYKHL